MNSLMKQPPVFSTLRREIDRLFDDVLDRGDGNGTQSSMWAPRADLSETEDHYVIRMDAPGLSKDDLTIELTDDTLAVSGERKSAHEERRENVHRVERSHGRFFRSFTLPHAGNGEQVTATMKDGVLTIEVPKREESKPRRIEIS